MNHGGFDRRDEDPQVPWHRRRRFWMIAAIAALLLAVLLFGGGSSSEEGEGGGGQPPATVSAAPAREAVWEDRLTAIGTLRAVQGVDVTTEIAGIVSAIRFTNGEGAEAGEALVLLDTTTERAELEALNAQREQARLAYERALRLTERGAIAEAEVEAAEANYQNLRAQAEQVATIIEKKRIEAPFSGELGIRQVDLGQYVGPGTAIVSLQQIAPIYVDFELPESAVARVREGQPVRLTVDAFEGRTFAGEINAVSPEIDQTTRQFTVQATIPNRDGALRPGMFADVTVLLPGSREVTIVPATAVTNNAYGDVVYAVARPDPKRQAEQQARREKAEEEQGGFLGGLFGGGSSEKGSGKTAGEGEGEGGPQQQPQYVARQIFVETGERRGLFIEIVEGIEPGQQVVTAGQLKLENDTPLRISEEDALDGVEPRPDEP